VQARATLDTRSFIPAAVEAAITLSSRSIAACDGPSISIISTLPDTAPQITPMPVNFPVRSRPSTYAHSGRCCWNSFQPANGRLPPSSCAGTTQ
jgi:hypothetical protein